MLSELVAIDAAYRALQPLDEAGRRRALRWLKLALKQEKTLSDADTAERAGAGVSAAGDAATQSDTAESTGVDAASGAAGGSPVAAEVEDEAGAGDAADAESATGGEPGTTERETVEAAASEPETAEPAAESAADTTPETAATETVTDAGDESPAAEPTTEAAASGTRATRRGRARAGSRSSGGANEAPAGTRRTRAGRSRAEAKPATGGRRRSGGRQRAEVAESTESAGERVYRRMPPIDDVLAAYRQVGTISGLADHFNVPRYTVQGWAQRLRKRGYQLGTQQG